MLYGQVWYMIYNSLLYFFYKYFVATDQTATFRRPHISLVTSGLYIDSL